VIVVTILEMSLSSVPVVLTVIVIRALFLHKLPKKIFLVLWGIVLCRLFLPFSLTSEYSVYALLNRTGAHIGQTSKTAATHSVILGFSTMPAVSVSWSMLVWCVGAIVTALAFLFPYIRFCQIHKTAIPLEDDKLNAWAAKYPVKRRVAIKQSENIDVPVTYGIVKPVILFPKSWKQSSEEQLRFVLVHELTHIRHFDILWKWLLFTVVSIHWFNPFVWVMYMLANRDIELSCDETVLWKTGVEFSKAAYAMSLIGLEEYKLKANPIGNYFSRNAIEERIIAIMKTPKITVWRVAASFILIAGTIAVLSAVSGAEGGSSADKTPAEKKAFVYSAYPYPVNAQGQTYGPNIHTDDPYETFGEPDLMTARGENGVDGYVKASDLLGPHFSSPEEAIAYQEAIKAASGYRSIPLYESDGKTVIGEFRLYYGPDQP
jgi:bla regulator protein BlaR1